MTALADGTAVLFGGVGYDGYLDDVYTLTLSETNQCIVGKDNQRRRHSRRKSWSHYCGSC